MHRKHRAPRDPPGLRTTPPGPPPGARPTGSPGKGYTPFRATWGTMLPKVLDLMTLVEDGYSIQSVHPTLGGALTFMITKGRSVRVIHFHPYEVPAIQQETNVLGVAK